MHPVVWCCEWPEDITQGVRDGTISMVDCEFAAYFIGECMLDELSEWPIAGLSSFLWMDNSPTEAIVLRQAPRAKSTMPAATFRWLALRQPRATRHQTLGREIKPDGRLLSRSYKEGYPDADDDAFLMEFVERFPLPP